MKKPKKIECINQTPSNFRIRFAVTKTTAIVMSEVKQDENGNLEYEIKTKWK